MKPKGVFLGIVLSIVLSVGSLTSIATTSFAAIHDDGPNSGLTRSQQKELYSIARQTWKFFDAATDPNTHLPLDNIGLYGAPARGAYTSRHNSSVISMTT